MNTGVDDAANLAWKLAAVVQGWGGPRLLESYQLERRPVAIRNTRAAQAMARQLGEVPVAESIVNDDSAPPAAARARVPSSFPADRGVRLVGYTARCPL